MMWSVYEALRTVNTSSVFRVFVLSFQQSQGGLHDVFVTRVSNLFRCGLHEPLPEFPYIRVYPGHNTSVMLYGISHHT